MPGTPCAKHGWSYLALSRQTEQEEAMTTTETGLLYTLIPCIRCDGKGWIDPAEFPGMSRPPGSSDEPKPCVFCSQLRVSVLCPWWWRGPARQEIFESGEHGGAWDMERFDDIPKFTYGGRKGWISRDCPRWMATEEELLIAV